MHTDREILMWIHERMEHQYKESACFDFMHRLRAIIAGIPAGTRSFDTGTNSLAALKEKIEKKPEEHKFG